MDVHQHCDCSLLLCPMLRLAQAVFGGPPQFIGGFGHQVRWATKKAAGSTKNGGTSPGQRLGLKKSGGQSVFVGQIIARQTGTKWRKGDGVGKDPIRLFCERRY